MKMLILGIIISPLFATCGVVAVNGLIIGSLTLEMITGFAFISYTSMGILGLPTIAIAKYKKWLKPWHSCLAGISVGLITLIVWLVPMMFADFIEFLKFIFGKDGIVLPISAIIAGFMGGVSYWFIAVRDINKRIKTYRDRE
jgi:hypothetical protein